MCLNQIVIAAIQLIFTNRALLYDFQKSVLSEEQVRYNRGK